MRDQVTVFADVGFEHAMRSSMLLLSLLSACGFRSSNVVEGDGHVVSQSRTGDAVSALSVEDAIQAEVIVGDGPSLTVRTDGNILELIETAVDDGVLRLRVKEGASVSPTVLTIEVHLPSLHELAASGAAQVRAQSLRDEAFALTVRDAAKVTLDAVDFDSLSVTAAGAASASLSGKSGVLHLVARDSATFLQTAFTAGNATVELEGAAQASFAMSNDARILTATARDTAELTITAPALATINASVLGSATISLSGSGSALDLVADNSATFSGASISITTAKLALSGAARATLSVSDHVSGRMSGSSRLQLSTQPASRPDIDLEDAAQIE
jgi:hypothetical protein